MRFQSDRLLALALVDRTGSLTAAAKLLGKTQPAISTQLRALEASIGEPLLVRRRYGVELTPVGQALLPAGQSIARSLEIAEEICSRLEGLEHGQLRLLTSTSVSVYFLPPVLALFHERYPAIELKLRHSNPDEALRQLGQGAADLAVIRGPLAATHTHQMNSSIVLTDETVLAVRPDHPLARRKSLSMTELDGLGIVSRGANSPTRRLVENIARTRGVTMHVKFEVETIEGIKEAVLQGFGGGFVSRLAISREVRSGQLVELHLNESGLVRQIMLIHPSAGQVSPRVQAFLTALQEVLASGGTLLGNNSAVSRSSPRSRLTTPT